MAWFVTALHRVTINATRLAPRLHCVWSEDRSVTLSDGTLAHAVETIDVALAPRRYCTHCMRTLSAEEETCPTGSPSCHVEAIERRIRGWIGLQRYLHATEFGIDFIRNGRKIEIGNKDLFEWTDGETVEVEYPTDDQRNRGRFVGEIHLDHCRVTYTKDRFERDDPAWSEMTRVVRGEGPLRPVVAKQRGYAGNGSPLYRFFQIFRRSSPQGKNALWSKILVVRDNDRAQQMADSFGEGEPDYLTDERWWQLVEEQDKEVLGDDGGEKGDPPLPDGFIDENREGPGGEGDPTGGDPLTSEPEPEPVPVAPARRQLHELTRKYVHPTFRVEYDVQAQAVESGDPDLPSGLPWTLRLEDVSTRTYGYLVDVGHEVFRSTTMTPLDALLVELTHRTVDFLRGQSQEPSVAGVLSDFRRQYSVETRLDPQEMIAQASETLGGIARAVPDLIEPGEGDQLFAELTEAEREAVARRMANRGVADHQALRADGRFWDYAEPDSLRTLFQRRPNLFLDGAYFDDPYSTLDFGSVAVTEEARRRVRAKYDAYLEDAVWLANQTPADVERADRDAVIRASCSVRLLRPDTTD